MAPPRRGQSKMRAGAPRYRLDPMPESDPAPESELSANDADATDTVDVPANTRLSLLLAMAMFVLVVDTSLMNVSISAVVRDLHTTVSGVQGAIALEALISAAFILINSKVGDLIGRRRAYVLGLCATPSERSR